MGRHAPAPKDEKISTHPIGRILAIPAKGERGRPAALAGYGMLVATVFGTLAWATTHEEPEPPRASPAPGVREDDAYREAPADGYQPTYLDGGGGIAGVPLTDKQRKALIAEARRRGLSVTEAYALAYGDGVRLRIARDGKVQVDTSDVKVPDHPVYIRAVQPTTGRKAEQARLVTPSKAEGEAEGHTSAAGKSQTPPVAKGAAGKPGKAEEKPAQAKPKDDSKARTAPPADDGYYPSSGLNYYEEEAKEEKETGIKAILPPALDSLVEQAGEVTKFLGEASTGPVQVVGPVQRGNHVMMMMSAPVTEDLTVQTTIAAPLDEEKPVQPVVTTVAVDTSTGEVVAKEKDTCDHVHEVPTVAMGQVVDVVLEAREGALPAEVFSLAE